MCKAGLSESIKREAPAVSMIAAAAARINCTERIVCLASMARQASPAAVSKAPRHAMGYSARLASATVAKVAPSTPGKMLPGRQNSMQMPSTPKRSRTSAMSGDAIADRTRRRIVGLVALPLAVCSDVDIGPTISLIWSCIVRAGSTQVYNETATRKRIRKTFTTIALQRHKSNGAGVAEPCFYRANKTFFSDIVMRRLYNGISPIMPKKTLATETAAAAPARVAKPKTPRVAPVVEVASTPRVKSVKHSKAASTPLPVAEVTPVAATPGNAYDQIAKIAYGYWEARGYQHGSSEQDWLRAEQEYLRQA